MSAAPYVWVNKRPEQVTNPKKQTQTVIREKIDHILWAVVVEV